MEVSGWIFSFIAIVQEKQNELFKPYYPIKMYIYFKI